jgi:hypothetical protein
MEAAAQGHVELFELLLIYLYKSGADVNIINKV